ncbi:MAG: hypothetical protein ACUBOA_04770 [Candidatus Loosdrechtia sp.]|uniref:hypothetical protein n=1 Tax=Candidatus Loosdrechtia sp. TaxID=3101272 RepID=UPI003A758BD8|nr:MAG: hypothetical protein QY305_14440 [Candidatus Jettenia sp. AMX2]
MTLYFCFYCAIFADRFHGYGGGIASGFAFAMTVVAGWIASGFFTPLRIPRNDRWNRLLKIDPSHPSLIFKKLVTFGQCELE